MRSVIKFMHLARKRKNSEENYIEFQRFQGDLVIKKLQKHINRKKQMTMLEVGSHAGGYTAQLRRLGQVVITLDKEPYKSTIERYKKERTKTRGSEIKKLCKGKPKVLFSKDKLLAIEGDITKTPFRDKVFDVIIASSIIEHVRNQEKMLEECHRILKDNRIVYLSFPPYYSPFGGHYLSPFHYLPGSLPEKVYKRWHPTKKKPYELYRTTLRGMKKKIRLFFIIKEMSPRLFTLLKPITHIPILNECLIHHIEFILKKKPV